MKRLIGIAAVAAVTLAASSAHAQQFINILTGGTAGVYYPLGVAIGKIYGDKISGAKTQVQATKGSVENLNLIQGGNDATLGLIANNFVRVAHRVSSCNNVNTTQYPQLTNITIEAAILSLQHSFIVDNYNCGTKLGKLTVTGAIVQKYRGPVGTGSAGSIATGYAKNYWYDDRFKYRSPPFFLTPIDAAWNIMRENEQQKAARQD